MNLENRFDRTALTTLAALAALGLLASVLFVSCKRGGGESQPADVDYYTCTMHPSVRSKTPGKCPICGMDLVPVDKRNNASTNETASGMASMPGMSTHETNTPAEREQPGEFAVPVERQQQIGVTFSTVEKQNFRRAIRTVGTVAPDKQREWDYVTRVDSYVQKLNVFSPGEIVEKGQPLLTIYSPELFTAQKEFVEALKMRDNAKARNEADVLDSAQQLVQSGKERLHLWNIDDRQIADLEKTREPQQTLSLISPFKGVVQQLGVEQGQRVATGDKLVNIADLSVVWVWAQFYQDDLPMLKKGLPVTISTASYPGQNFNGRIALIDPFINGALRTARARIEVENPGLKLRPDMYVDVDLSMAAGGGLAVPVGAVLPTGLHNIAFVDKGQGRLEPRFLELGEQYGNVYEVKSGLKENERVVTSANFLIDAEAQVQGALKTW